MNKDNTPHNHSLPPCSRGGSPTRPTPHGVDEETGVKKPLRVWELSKAELLMLCLLPRSLFGYTQRDLVWARCYTLNQRAKAMAEQADKRLTELGKRTDRAGRTAYQKELTRWNYAMKLYEQAEKLWQSAS